MGVAYIEQLKRGSPLHTGLVIVRENMCADIEFYMEFNHRILLCTTEEF